MKTLEESKNLDDIVEVTIGILESAAKEDQEGLEEFMNVDEDTFTGNCNNPLRSGLAMYIRGQTRMWDENSPIFKHFNDNYGITHADDMSGIVLHCVWRDYHNKARDVNTVAKNYKAFWDRLQKRN